MRRFGVALGWTIVLEWAWAALLVAAWIFLLDPLWLAQNFLQPDLLKQTDLEGYLTGLKSALITAAAVIFAISGFACILWHLWGASRRIEGPGRAARHIIAWVVLLGIGMLLSAAAVYYYLQLNNLVREDAWIALYPAGVILFVLSYYIGTLFPTAPKLRPAVPLGSQVPALPGYA